MIDPFGNATTYEYDLYHLLPVKVTDALNNEMVVEKVDYQTLQPQRIRDINQNISEVLFDPMGMVSLDAPGFHVLHCLLPTTYCFFENLRMQFKCV